MKIGFDSKRLYCNSTGLGNYSRTLVKNLQELYSDKEYYLYSPKLKMTPETTFFYDNPHFQTHIAKTKFKSYWKSYSIVDQLKKDNIELYHGLSNEIPFNLKRTNIKSIVTIHDLIFNILPDTYPLVDRKIYDLKFRKSCLNADRIIAISNNTKTDIVKFYNINPDKIEVIYQSCAPLFYTSTEQNNSGSVLQKYGIPNEYLLFVGSVEKRKNIKVIIDSYQHLLPEFKIPLVVIGGHKSHKKKLQRLINEKRMGEKIIWIPNLKDNHDLQTVYKKSMALIYPSLYEGFGLPVAEALLSKTPVITSNVSSLPEAGGPGSLYINPNNPEELADAIKKVLTDTELRNTMIKNGYEYAIQTFAPERITHQIMNCYEKTVE
jgi:glycosyltransferase involved in cell wall biosynthesis